MRRDLLRQGLQGELCEAFLVRLVLCEAGFIPWPKVQSQFQTRYQTLKIVYGGGNCPDAHTMNRPKMLALFSSVASYRDFSENYYVYAIYVAQM